MYKCATGVLVLSVMVWAGGCAAPGKTVTEKRERVMKMHDEALADLYKKLPRTQEEIKSAAGHAVLANFGIGTIVGGGGGWGVAIDAQGQPTYMQMGMFSAGLGLSVKDWRYVLVFSDPKVYNDFIKNQWRGGGDAEAAFQFGDFGGQASAIGYFGEGLRVYQFVKNGIALRASVPIASYYQYKQLNDPTQK